MSERTTGITLVPRDGHAYRFDPGALCLDFLLSGGPGPIARWESLTSTDDLTSWFSRTRLHLDPADIRAAPADVDHARRMRDALWRLVHGRLGRGAPDPGDLDRLNRAAADPPLVPRIAGAPHSDGHRTWQTPIDASRVTSHIARDAIDLLTGPWSHRIRECGSDNCLLVFVDTSRPGKRRWCSMERCGNRSKVRALRARRSPDTPEA